MTAHTALIDRLARTRDLPDDALAAVLTELTPAEHDALCERARAACQAVYGREIYLRGLIEFTSYCKNDCYYCGLRRGNARAERYRLTEREILDCCRKGYALGFRTFVLQGGEDPFFTDERLCSLTAQIRAAYPDCAITLSVGEKPRESYQAYFDAGAERYLLREETADPAHYRLLHPAAMDGERRKQCLRDLKAIGYQVGCGIMVGSPGQTTAHVIADLRFMQALGPHMIGIGPFIPHKDTPFCGKPAGTLAATLRLLAVLRLMFPHALLPATTALGTIDPQGRELGVLAGANVIMPNLSPAGVRKKYLLYDGKICTGDEAAECRRCLAARMARIGYQTVVSRGDYRA